MIGRDHSDGPPEIQRSVRLALMATLLTSLLLAPSLASAQPMPPRPAVFFKNPSLTAPVLSPNGRYLAAQVSGANGRQRLAVIDLQTMGSPQVIAEFANADVAGHSWLNDERLVFRLANPQDGGTRVLTPGLWAVDRDGSHQRQLILSNWGPPKTLGPMRIKERQLELNWGQASGALEDNSDEVLVVRRHFADDPNPKGLAFARLDTRTGKTSSVSSGLPDKVVGWTNSARGELWTVSTNDKGRYQTYVRQGDGWRLWQENPTYEATILPFWYAPEGPMLATDQHENYRAIFKVDPATLQRDAEPLLSAKGFDVDGSVQYDRQARKLLGIHYEIDADSTAWFHPAMKAFQADIDAKLPGSVNRISCGHCLSSPNLLVTASSDRHPPIHYLYRVADKQLVRFSTPDNDLQLQSMGQRDYHRIAARDGLPLPVLVTQPAGGVGKGSHPTVVLVRGGVGSRNTHWAWEPVAQFLASRGYLVLEPEYRGSGGYGREHFRAGWKQWGLRMQDDLADTLDWAVRQGWADPRRTCIIGGGPYGGYAALMGAVTQGEAFRCAVSWGGVTDIAAMADMHWSYMSEEWRVHGMKRLVADPATDSAQIRATSPLQRAQEIRLPLLLAYGGSDGYVPLKHGTDLKAALRKDQELEWVVYPDETHRFASLPTRDDFWGRVERFLARHLGPRN